MVSRTRRLRVVLPAVLIGVVAGGCAGPSGVLERLGGAAGPRLSAGDFRAPDAGMASFSPPGPVVWFDPMTTPSGAGVPSDPAAAAGSPAIATVPGGIGSGEASVGQVEAVAGGPDLSGGTPGAIEAATLLDVKVGDVNGRPIFASDFFEDMERFLIEEARVKTRRQWQQDTAARISEKLGGIIAGELLRAEALEMLPQGQREAGLGRVIARERAAIQSRAGGSLTQAQRALMEERGLTMEEYLAQFQDQSLVNLSLSQMRQQVQVSGRDIRNHYQRNYDTYNPKPSARLREIVVLTSNTEAVASVSAQLERGVAFEEIAAGPLNTSTFRAQGGVRDVPLEGGYRGTNLLRNDALNAAAWELSPGQWAGPIRYGAGDVLTAWIYLERVTTAGRTLYEAQVEIARELRDLETRQRFRQTIERLSQRAGFSGEQEMVRALLDLATARYYPVGQPEPATVPGRRP